VRRGELYGVIIGGFEVSSSGLLRWVSGQSSVRVVFMRMMMREELCGIIVGGLKVVWDRSGWSEIVGWILGAQKG
jgi:hypothetical protein